MRRIIYTLIIIILITIPLGCSFIKSAPIEVFLDGNIEQISKVVDNNFQIYKDGIWKKLYVKGVNIANTPAEMKEKEYVNWFQQIGVMNANTVRVNYVQSPEFYKALFKYNKSSENPIYLFQGIPLNEELLEEMQDPFKLDIIVPFKEEILHVIDIIHGNSGKYNEDISPYLMGYILGGKWNTNVVDYTNRNRQDKKDYHGQFVYTEEARPFEHFLANVMDHALTYEADKYKWQHPISFQNSVTTDILTHAYEPIKEEDFVSINPNVIKLKANTVGQFASYEVFPYYPEFLNLDPKYTKYIDHRGKVNNYAGYLKDLIQANDLPVVITDFGLPSSRGLSRVSVHGYNKGLLSEEEQGLFLANMFEDIIIQGGAGGIISNWQDQWAIWSNAEDSNEQFGLLSFDRLKVKVDGDLSEWKKNKVAPFYTVDKKVESNIRNLFIDQDERYLYFAIEYTGLKEADLETLIFLDITTESGKSNNLINPNISVNSTDYIIHITKHGLSQILISDDESEEDNVFKQIQIGLSEEIVNFRTGQTLPGTEYNGGILREGNGDPDSKDYNSLTDYNINQEKNIIELRIPWALIGFTNPSDKSILGDKRTEGINVSVGVYDKNTPENFAIFPNPDTGEAKIYTWDNWDEPIKEERLKSSYNIIKNMFYKY